MPPEPTSRDPALDALLKGLGDVAEVIAAVIATASAEFATPPAPPPGAPAPTSAPGVPLVDLFDEGRELLVVIELRGLPEQALLVEAREDILTIEADGERRHLQELLLPAAVEPTPLQRACRNGIVELRFEKKGSKRGTPS